MSENGQGVYVKVRITIWDKYVIKSMCIGLDRDCGNNQGSLRYYLDNVFKLIDLCIRQNEKPPSNF